MAVRNWQSKRAQSYLANQKTISSGTAYTVRVGGTTYGFAIDNPVVVAQPSDNITLTIPDGYYVGQTLLLTLEGNTGSKTVTVTTTTGSDYTMASSGMYILLLWCGATTGWVYVVKSSTT